MTGFSDPILTGDGSLIRKAAKSPNYATGSAGWSVNADGSAEFNNLTVRGKLIVQSTTQGVFVYKGTPGPGTLIVALAPADGVDAYGNAYTQGVYMSGYVDGDTVNALVLQPKNVGGSTFQPGQLFTETFATGECQTWITSPYDTKKGQNAATILMRGSDATNAGGCSITFDAFSHTLIGDVIVSNGILRASNCVGSVNVSFTSQTSFTVNVTFPEPFPTPPTVITNINSGAGVTSRWDSRATGVTTTGFQLFVYSPSGGTAQTWANIPVQWLAIGA